MSLAELIEPTNKKNVINNNETVNVVSNSRPENYNYFTDEMQMKLLGKIPNMLPD